MAGTKWNLLAPSKTPLTPSLVTETEKGKLLVT